MDGLHNNVVLEKLGFESNSWFFYDARFEKFFNFFTDNITEDNLLTDIETVNKDELIQQGQYIFDEEERKKQIECLKHEYPGFLEYNKSEALDMEKEIKAVESVLNADAMVLKEMDDIKSKMTNGIHDMELCISVEQKNDKELLQQCQSKANHLENIQQENLKLYQEFMKCFTVQNSPPLFVHQFSLDQYFSKCDTFLQYFTLYVKENFKIQEFMDIEDPVDFEKISIEFERLNQRLQYYSIANIKAQAKYKSTESLIEQLDFSRIHVTSIADIIREKRELELLNMHHLSTTYETLLNDLETHVQRRIQQRIELILYENTKQKLERARKRYNSVQSLLTIISDALSNAEIMWIAIQLDLEKRRHTFDRSIERMRNETLSCVQRIKYMKSYNNNTKLQNTKISNILNELSGLLSQQLGQDVSADIKTCLFEYEKFCRLISYTLQNLLIHKKPYTLAMEQLKEIENMELSLVPFVYDGPCAKPMSQHIRYFSQIFNVKQQHNFIEKSLKSLRTQFQENNERMKRDKLYRYRQLLWIWFLTEPEKLLYAIDEAKKSSASSSSTMNLKSLGSLKRK